MVVKMRASQTTFVHHTLCTENILFCTEDLDRSKDRLIWFQTYGIWMLYVQNADPLRVYLNILWNNPIWPFHATSSCLVRGSVTFYYLNKKPLWSFAPTPQHRTVKTQNGTHEILVISIWFCQNFPLKTSKFSLIYCVLFCFVATILAWNFSYCSYFRFSFLEQFRRFCFLLFDQLQSYFLMTD